MIPTPSHLLGRISPIFPPFFLVFCAFSPPGRDGSNEPQAETQGQETAGTGTKSAELRPSFDAPDANQRINWQDEIAVKVSLDVVEIMPLDRSGIAGTEDLPPGFGALCRCDLNEVVANPQAFEAVR